MKNPLLLFFGLLFIPLNAQTKQIVVYSNDLTPVTFVFKNNIKKAFVGTDDFFFGYEKKGTSNLGRLIAAPKSLTSNLFVTTSNGLLFSFIIKHKNHIAYKDQIFQVSSSMAFNYVELQKKNAFVLSTLEKNKDSITNTSVSKILTKNDFDYNLNLEKTKKKELDSISQILLKDTKNYYRRTVSKDNNVYLRLKNYYYYKEQLFFYLELENKSNIDFDINFIRFFSALNKKNKKRITQRIALGKNGKPLYSSPIPKRVKTGETIPFVMVYTKFSLKNKKHLIIDVSELKGERVLSLKIDSHIYDNPQKI